MPTFDERPTSRSIRMCRHTGYFVGKPTRLASIMRLHLERAGLEVREHQGDLLRRPAQVQEMLHHAQWAIRRDRARPHFGADTRGVGGGKGRCAQEIAVNRQRQARGIAWPCRVLVSTPSVINR